MSNKKQLNKWIEQYGIDTDIIRVRVLGQFPIIGDLQLISVADANAARERGKTIDPTKSKDLPVIFGVDPAWMGEDLFVAYMRQGNYSKVLFTMPKNDDDALVAGKLARLEDEYGMTKGFIDQGYGTGIYSVLKSMGRGDTWELIPFASKPNNDYYANKRAEMWDDMKKWLKEGGTIEDKDEIFNDLIAPQAFLNNKGKLQLESKQDMRERGQQSPNFADALALTFAQPVRLKTFNRFRANRKPRKYGAM